MSISAIEEGTDQFDNIGIITDAFVAKFGNKAAVIARQQALAAVDETRSTWLEIVDCIEARSGGLDVRHIFGAQPN